MNPATATDAPPSAATAPRFWAVQVAAWAAYGTLIYLTLLPTIHPEASWTRLLIFKAVRTALGCGLSFLMRPVYRAVWARTRAVGSVAAASLVGSLVFGALWGFLYRVVWMPFEGVAAGQPWGNFPREVLDLAYVLLAWSASYFAVKYWSDTQEQKARALEAVALARDAQLQMLRYQLNPHFLFNALNSIRALASSDPARAKLMVTELSTFLRYSLLESPSNESTVGDEVEAIRSYLAIEKIRFEELLDVEIDVEPDAEAVRIPTFLVLPLVENAVKHGMRDDGPLRVRLTARAENGSLRIEVANTGALAGGAKAPGFGIGLTNLRSRLERVAGAARFDLVEREGWTCARVEIAEVKV